MKQHVPDLSVRWSKREKALLYHWESDKPTSGLLCHFFEGVKYGDTWSGLTRLGITRQHPSDERTLAQELDARGYDLTTLKFSISKKSTV
jgi:hypothetical protein